MRFSFKRPFYQLFRSLTSICIVLTLTSCSDPAEPEFVSRRTNNGSGGNSSGGIDGGLSKPKLEAGVNVNGYSALGLISLQQVYRLLKVVLHELENSSTGAKSPLLHACQIVTRGNTESQPPTINIAISDAKTCPVSSWSQNYAINLEYDNNTGFGPAKIKKIILNNGEIKTGRISVGTSSQFAQIASESITLDHLANGVFTFTYKSDLEIKSAERFSRINRRLGRNVTGFAATTNAELSSSGEIDAAANQLVNSEKLNLQVDAHTELSYVGSDSEPKIIASALQIESQSPQVPLTACGLPIGAFNGNQGFTQPNNETFSPIVEINSLGTINWIGVKRPLSLGCQLEGLFSFERASFDGEREILK